MLLHIQNISNSVLNDLDEINSEIQSDNETNTTENKNTCQTTIILHSSNIFPHPVFGFYYQTDYILNNLMKYLQSPHK